MPADLLLYIFIAVGLVIWLRKTLGTRTGAERDRSEELTKIITAQESSPDIKKLSDNERGLQLSSTDVSEESVRHDLRDLMDQDPSFDIKTFTEGAKDAFALIVEAFAKGDVDTLKDLLSPGVYASFESVIEDRRVRGESVSTEVHAVKSCTILNIKRIGKMVFIKMRFIADETCVVKNRDGEILFGHPDKITTMNDVWTFGRELRSKDPTWYLFETADDVVEEFKTPLPDATSAHLN